MSFDKDISTRLNKKIPIKKSKATPEKSIEKNNKALNGTLAEGKGANQERFVGCFLNARL